MNEHEPPCGDPPTDKEPVILGAEEPYCCFSATLRIWGDIPDLNDISRHFGLTPTHSHRKGERRGPHSPGYLHDLWSYTVPVEEERPLEEHILALWEAITARRPVSRSAINIWNCFMQLEIPFGVSVIVLA